MPRVGCQKRARRAHKKQPKQSPLSEISPKISFRKRVLGSKAEPWSSPGRRSGGDWGGAPSAEGSRQGRDFRFALESFGSFSPARYFAFLFRLSAGVASYFPSIATESNQRTRTASWIKVACTSDVRSYRTVFRERTVPVVKNRAGSLFDNSRKRAKSTGECRRSRCGALVPVSPVPYQRAMSSQSINCPAQSVCSRL